MNGDDTTEIGFFGKLPALGDFVSRELSRPQVKCIDDWMQTGIRQLQSASDIWLQAYLVTPVWQFLIPRGQWAESALYGTLMPSVDRVGRYFPLLTSSVFDANANTAVVQANLSQRALDLPKALEQLLEPDPLLALLRQPSAVNGRSPLPLFARFNPAGDRSLWWTERRDDAPFREISHRGAPDSELFLRLFGH